MLNQSCIIDLHRQFAKIPITSWNVLLMLLNFPQCTWNNQHGITSRIKLKAYQFEHLRIMYTYVYILIRYWVILSFCVCVSVPPLCKPLSRCPISKLSTYSESLWPCGSFFILFFGWNAAEGGAPSDGERNADKNGCFASIYIYNRCTDNIYCISHMTIRLPYDNSLYQLSSHSYTIGKGKYIKWENIMVT